MYDVGNGNTGDGNVAAFCYSVQDFGDTLIATEVHLRSVATSVLGFRASGLEVACSCQQDISNDSEDEMNIPLPKVPQA